VAARKLRKYVLDSNCFIDATRDVAARASLEAFSLHAAPGLYLSSVVAADYVPARAVAELTLERHVLSPYVRRGRSFLFDILLAHSCREAGATLVSANTRDLERIHRIFSFDFVAPCPRLL
jgi:predicted nucleic acid-binding protein